MDAEIKANAEDFRNNLGVAIEQNIKSVLAKDTDKIDVAYASLTTLQAIRTGLLEGQVSDGSLGFYFEAQSDGLTSQVLILSGSARSALKSLRSLIENIIRSIYYADHPIEYRQWEAGNHRPTFKALFDYVAAHPDIANRDAAIVSVPALYGNWKKLSQAVHASAKAQRMSVPDEVVTIWKTSQKSVGDWFNFQQSVVKDISLLYLCIYAHKLQGAAQKNLRGSLSLVIPQKLDQKIAQELKVNIVRS